MRHGDPPSQASEACALKISEMVPPPKPAAAEIDHIRADGARDAGEKDFRPIGSNERRVGKRRQNAVNNYLDTKYLFNFKYLHI
ncbi:hypothetical protein [Rhizobium sp. BT03]|uniref:hypothetical protein n=1 Tax=Rhizobium sp. BT03 TaxID=3045156 RepID=UPI0024B3D6CD|nr:hypothetical protein [Rhizobium sp. BT03]WHO77137.1 hypothetical protein QMO80_006347 [Rhizobium sp. BT03]